MIIRPLTDAEPQTPDPFLGLDVDVGVESLGVGGRRGGVTLDGGVGGGGELTEEGVGVGEVLMVGVVGLRLRGVCGVKFGTLVVGVLAVGLLVVDVQACGGLVAVVLLQADQAGLEDFGVTLGLAGPVILALVVLTGDLLRLQARLGHGGGDSGSDDTQR